MKQNLLFNQTTALSKTLGKRFAMVLTMLLIVGVASVWGAVISGNTYNTTSSMPAGWSKNGDYNNNSYLKLVASTNYIQTDAFCVKSFSSIKIKARKFGGPTDAQAKITVEWIVDGSATTLGTITPSSTTLTDYTLSSPASITANKEGYVKISCKGASSSKGSGVSQVTITYTSGTCSGGGNTGGASGDDSGDVSGGDCDVWKLVTDASDLKAGDQIVIAASNADYALSTTQQTNNRTGTSITKTGNTLEINSFVQILTLEEGSETGTFAFKDTDGTNNGYLYAASSSSNQLKTKNSLDDNGSWTIAIASNGVATIKAQGTYTRNTMQYNNSSTLFACYASASQSPVCIYKYVECATEPTVFVIPKCGGDGGVTWLVVIEWFATF